jgi:hypothetical protein
MVTNGKSQFFWASGVDLLQNGHFKNVQNRFGSAGLEKLFACRLLSNIRKL